MSLDPGFARVVRESGLSKVELARLYGVSRQAIHGWCRAKQPRTYVGTYTARMATAITATLLISLDRKILPLAAMDREKRTARVAKMSQTLSNLKPAPK